MARIFWMLYVLAISGFHARYAIDLSSVAGMVWAAFHVVWLIATGAAGPQRRRARLVSLACFALVATLLLVRSVLRVAFILRHGGMDCSECQGSPLLFEYYWMIEMAELLSGLVLATWFWWSTRMPRMPAPAA